MRIAVDFQGAQTGSRFRGIGHYSSELVKSLIRGNPHDEVILVLNGLFPESIEPIRAEFEDLLPQENIRVWYAPGPIERFGQAACSLREIAEAIREYFLRSLEPDLILVTSIFEGLDNDAVISIKKFANDVPVAAVFYDLTPLYMPDEQFRTNISYRSWYRERIDSLRKCDLLLAISESSRQEVIHQLGPDPKQVVNISGGRSDAFSRRNYQPGERAAILQQFGIRKPFILYAGGIEPSKNLNHLIEALSFLPASLQQTHEFVCVGRRNPGEIEQIHGMARDASSSAMVKVIDFVSQSQLIDLYNLCELFVFPSLREGFGLPPLEAMACGAPTIVSDRTSLPEVVSNQDALFDPLSPESIAGKIKRVLTDPIFKASLVERGLKRSRELTWDAAASAALRELEKRFGKRRAVDHRRRAVVTHTSAFKPNKKRIIVQKLDHHGDFLLALPAIAKLRARYPDGRLEALVGGWNRAAAEACGLFDEIHTFEFFKARSSVEATLDEQELDALLARLPYYDFAIDLRRQTDTRSILVKLKAHQYFGYRTGESAIDSLLTRPLEIHPDAGGVRSYFDETHTCEQMLRIVDALPFDRNDYVKLPDLGKKAPRRPGSVAIFPTAGNDSRQWHPEYFAALIQALCSDRAVTEINLFCGSAGDLDKIRYKPGRKVRVNCGLSFSDLFTELSGNMICLGNNSFGVHLAGYAGCRTIGIYSGHELPQQWGPPFGDSVAVTVDAPCAPCHLPDRQSCPHDLFCLSDISVETVKAAVLDALAGEPLQESYSHIVRTNPASAIKPLLDAVNKSKFLGRIDGLTDEQRVAFAAAVSIDFPERVSSRRFIYFDVSGLLEAGFLSQSKRRIESVHQMLRDLQKNATGEVKPIATGLHDHEFYTVELESIESSLYFGDRFRRIVRPSAGDIYIGPDTYENRNPAQWNLLATWRQMGVFTIFAAPPPLDMEKLGKQEEDGSALAAYLFAIGSFDAIFAPDEEIAGLRKWIDDHGAARLREITYSSDLLKLIQTKRPQVPVGTRAAGLQEQFMKGSSSLVRDPRLDRSALVGDDFTHARNEDARE